MWERRWLRASVDLLRGRSQSSSLDLEIAVQELYIDGVVAWFDDFKELCWPMSDNRLLWSLAYLRLISVREG